VLYEMATGRRAFDGKTTASVIAAILEREPPAISRASIKPAVNTSIETYNGGTAGFAISSDGSRLAYVALGPDGRS